MPGNILLRTVVGQACRELLIELPELFVRVEFVVIAVNVEGGGVERLVVWVGIEIAGNSAADADNAGRHVRVSKGETEIESAGLRKAEQVNLRSIDQTVRRKFLDHIKQKLVMQCDRLGSVTVGQPAKAGAVAVVRLAKMLVRALYGSDHPALRGDVACLAHHIAFVCPVAVHGYQ